MPEYQLHAQDAMQASMNFMVAQTAVIEPGVYRQRYPSFDYASLIPIDRSAPEWVRTITVYSMEHAGKAEWTNLNAKDIPTVDLAFSKSEQIIHEGSVGYSFGYGEVNEARVSGVNLPAEKAFAAREAYTRFMYNLAMTGDATKGYEGLFNYSTVPQVSLPATGTGSSTLWSTKSPDQMVADVNFLLGGMYTATNEVEMADTLIMPTERMQTIASTRLGDGMSMTILEFIRQANIYTVETGRPLRIIGKRGLSTAGAGSTARMIAYRRDPSVLKLHVPMPHRFLPVQQNVLQYIVPGIFRTGGLDVRLPYAIRYGDGL